ncbi:MAG: RDD family protein [Burkholderiales bacterium]|nr:RDD family protein [Burkholderiales bacterium]
MLPPATNPPATSTTAPIAGLWRRFGAFVHELLFLVAYVFIVGLIFAPFSGESMSSGRPQVLSGPIAVLQQVYLFVSIGAYFIYFWTEGRRTLAFKTWSLHLVATDGSGVSRKQAVVRYLATWIGPALGLAMYMIIGRNGTAWWIFGVFANFLWAFADPTRQFLHDRIAGTRVVVRKE